MVKNIRTKKISHQDKKDTGLPHPVDIHVGKRLRLRRSVLGFSQEYVGKKLGVTFQQIQKYERGVNRVGSSRLYDFARILKVPVAYFFEALEEPQGFAENTASETDGLLEIPHMLESKETLALVRAYYQIQSPIVRKKVLALIKSMALQAADYKDQEDGHTSSSDSDSEEETFAQAASL